MTCANVDYSAQSATNSRLHLSRIRDLEELFPLALLLHEYREQVGIIAVAHDGRANMIRLSIRLGDIEFLVQRLAVGVSGF